MLGGAAVEPGGVGRGRHVSVPLGVRALMAMPHPAGAGQAVWDRREGAAGRAQ